MIFEYYSERLTLTPAYVSCDLMSWRDVVGLKAKLEEVWGAKDRTDKLNAIASQAETMLRDFFKPGWEIASTVHFEYLPDITSFILGIDSPYAGFVEYGTGIRGAGSIGAEAAAEVGWSYNGMSGWWYSVTADEAEYLKSKGVKVYTPKLNPDTHLVRTPGERGIAAVYQTRKWLIYQLRTLGYSVEVTIG